MLADMDRRPVHELDRHGDDAGGDDATDARGRLLGRVEAEQHRAGAFRRLQQPHRGLGDDAELALGADDQREEIIARRIEIIAADIENLAIHHHDADGEHVVHRHPVFQAMRAAGIGGDVAADGAGDLARRVRRIEEAFGCGGLGDADIGEAGLDAGNAVGRVDRQNLVHAREAEHDRVLERQRAAAKRGAGPARHDLDVVLVAEAQDLADLLGGGRQHDRERQAAIGGERVGLEGAAPFLVGDHARVGSELFELLNDVVPAREHRGIRGRKADMRHRWAPSCGPSWKGG